ncbi:hypothetical protein D3C86_1797590 [compost metagenome]
MVPNWSPSRWLPKNFAAARVNTSTFLRMFGSNFRARDRRRLERVSSVEIL